MSCCQEAGATELVAEAGFLLPIERSFAAPLVVDLALGDIHQVLEVFALDLDRLRDLMGAAATANDRAIFRRAAHGMGGAAGAVGAARLSRICREGVEHGIDEPGMRESLAMIEAEMAPIQRELARVLAWLAESV
jgi:HPt (histidine-containing phosphotransfer) domain-containing protein